MCHRKKALSPARCEQAAAHLWEQLTCDPHFVAAQTVLFYAALPDEVPTKALLENYLEQKICLLPVMVDQEIHLRHYREEATLRRGTLGIDEPIGDDFTTWEQIDYALIPGIAFDRAFHRLGRGKGYYDRFLSHPALHYLHRVGVAFDFQVVDHVPVEAHDVVLDDLIVV